MAKLYLKEDHATIKEITVKGVVTIGRLADNVLQIENLAVSGHHARVLYQDGSYFIEDNDSTNGTWVNEERVTRKPLKSGDRILVGRHVIVFEQDAHEPPPIVPRPVAAAPSRAAESGAGAQAAAPAPAPAPISRGERVGFLTVVEGKTDRHEYVLTGKLHVIGSSDMASIRLKGWFAPRVAAVISHRDSKYFLAASEEHTRVKVNGEEISGQHELRDGDTLDIAGVRLSFAITS